MSFSGDASWPKSKPAMMETMTATLRITVAADMGLERLQSKLFRRLHCRLQSNFEKLELADGRVVLVGCRLNAHRAIHRAIHATLSL